MKPWVSDSDLDLYVGDVRDVLAQLPERSVHCCVTSPPYWGLRDYGVEGQLGLEATPQEYVANMVGVFREVRRVLRDDGTLWLNLGDSFDAKNLQGIPWRVAFALQDDGWRLRSDIIWSKPNPMPESITDRPTKSHEYLFLLTKSAHYFYDAEAIKEKATGTDLGILRSKKAADGQGPTDRQSIQKRVDAGVDSRNGNPDAMRNARSVWEINTHGYQEAHFATFPEELPRRCIKAGSPEGGTVLDPFGGSGTTAKVARDLGRKSVLIELNPEYAQLAATRLQQLSLLA